MNRISGSISIDIFKIFEKEFMPLSVLLVSRYFSLFANSP